MCAISGIISQIAAYQRRDFLIPILSAMTKRGPDGTQIEVLANEGCFGHNRLSIIDLSERAKQPMWDTTSRYCLTFNGEIYNYQALRRELVSLGHLFRTESDSEVLIEAFAEWGISSLARFVGMFAFAVWDKQECQLYLARDRMGEKPLYYAPIDGSFQKGLVFASELKGLIQYPWVERTLSMTALNHYLSFNYTSTADAIFQGVYKLPPASYLQYDLKTHQYKVREYWSLAECFHQKLTISFAKAQEQLEILLAEVIKDKLIADVPLGAFLSGGIDSATIVSEMCRYQSDQVNTYSIGFPEKSYSELALSQKTARYLKVNHQTRTIVPDFSTLLPKLIYAFDEPFADTSLIPTYLLCAFAREKVTVSLSGDGGDELFGGYITYQADRYHQFMQYLPASFRKMLIKLSKLLSASFNKVSFDYKAKQFLCGSLLDSQNAHLSWREIFSADQKKSLFHSDYTALSMHSTKEESLRWFQDVSGCHYLDQAMYVDMKTWLVDDILVKVDRASMAHSLEVRAPFLDHRLVEFAAKIPVDYKIQKKNGKRILKNKSTRRLPPHVFRQPKRGFNSPVSSWLSHELFDIAYEVTTGTYLSQWFNKTAIEKMWVEHRKGVCDHGHRLFNLLCLGLWCQSYLKGVVS
ncbi:MAG: hypothetical protein ACD_60C00027G0012 [uncultured bacterium]|nr:MAG: hypothetical protein ACD_60C00027G0012 [uncultured bacterium]